MKKETGKPWYRSKTILFNLATGAVALSQTVLPFLGPHGIAIATGVNVVGNVILRTMTNQPITK